MTPKEGGTLGKGNNQKKSNNNNNKKIGGNKRNCNYCGIFSHNEVDCHKKAADLKDGKTNNDGAAAAISNGVEFLWMLQERQKQGSADGHKLLLQTSICNGDTADMTDMPPHAKDMVGMKKSAKTVSIIINKSKTWWPLVTYLELFATTKAVRCCLSR